MKLFFYSIIILICTAIFLFKSPPSSAYPNFSIQQEDTINFYLEINGSVRKMKNAKSSLGDNPWLDSAIVTIYQNNTVYNQIFTTRRGKCSMRLPLNRDFIIELSKPGFVSKKFEVNTKIPVNKKNSYDFSFDMDLFESIEGLNTKVLEKPIAIVFYNITNNRFEYDAAYTNRINNELKTMYHNYYLLEKKHKSGKNQ